MDKETENVINLPVSDTREIENTVAEIRKILRDDMPIVSEALDWFDWANNHLDEKANERI